MCVYLDKDSGKCFTKAQLEILWNELDPDTKSDYSDDGICNFEEWLDCATDFSGHLQVL